MGTENLRDAEFLAQARKRNAAQRALALADIAEGRCNVQATIVRATKPGGHSLLRLRLHHMLEAIDGLGSVGASKKLKRMAAMLGDRRLDVTSLNVAWLLNPHSGGRRYQAWLDAVVADPQPNWPGFPWAPRPDKAQLSGVI